MVARIWLPFCGRLATRPPDQRNVEVASQLRTRAIHVAYGGESKDWAGDFSQWPRGSHSIERGGHPLGRVSTGKKTAVPKSLLHRVDSPLRQVFVLPGSIQTCHFVFDCGPFLSEPLLSEAIRSVTHLVLARLGLFWLNHISNRKERTRRLLPCSLRLGFFGQPFYYHTRRFWQARVRQFCAHPPSIRGPENVQCRSVFIQFVKSCGSPAPVAWPRRPTRF